MTFECTYACVIFRFIALLCRFSFAFIDDIIFSVGLVIAMVIFILEFVHNLTKENISRENSAIKLQPVNSGKRILEFKFGRRRCRIRGHVSFTSSARKIYARSKRPLRIKKLDRHATKM